MTRTDLINLLMVSNEKKDYLEIGVQKPDNNFNKILAETKVSVDPDPSAGAIHKCTSDHFFDWDARKFDIIFVDGFHEAPQVERDIINSMAALKPGGFIVLHDCNPPAEKDQLVPRQYKIWYGDVWRAFVGFRLKYPGITAFCLDHDCGLGVIKYSEEKIEPGFITDMPWEEFSKNRKQLLGII